MKPPEPSRDVRDPAAGDDRSGISGPVLRNIKLIIEYDGTRYFGWQSQVDRNTVQSELQKAVGRVVDHPVTAYGSGRTDRGVHALGQVANFHTPKGIPCEKLLLGINTYLPEDIRVRSVEEVPDGFHARHSARGKRYRYTILRSSVERVMVRHFCEVIPEALDVAAMKAGAVRIHGLRDYKALQGNAKRRSPKPGEEPRSTVRTVTAVLVRESGPFILIDAFGLGFLYGMVRTIAGTLVEMAKGKRDPASMEEVLDSQDRQRAGFKAAAQGLCLLEVYYGEGALEAAVELAREDSDAQSKFPGGELDRVLKMLT